MVVKTRKVKSQKMSIARLGLFVAQEHVMVELKRIMKVQRQGKLDANLDSCEYILTVKNEGVYCTLTKV